MKPRVWIVPIVAAVMVTYGEVGFTFWANFIAMDIGMLGLKFLLIYVPIALVYFGVRWYARRLKRA